MTWENAAYPIEAALAQSQDAWDLFVSNWGNVAAPSADGTSESFPALNKPGLPSLSAVAIGPQSTVDRCLVNWALNGVVAASLWDYPHRVTKDAPLLFTQPGNKGIVTALVGTTPSSGTITIFNDIAPGQYVGDASIGTRFGAAYVKVDGTAAVFGAGAPNGAKWLAPLLHLVCYLRPPVSGVPLKRAPLIYQQQVVAVAAGGTGEKLGFQVPTFGRKTVIVNITSTEAGNYRIGLLQHLTNAALGGPNESPGVAATAMTANVTARQVITPCNADYMMVYYDVAVGGGTVRCAVHAYDD